MTLARAQSDSIRARLSEYLARNGLKQTRQREAIMDVFLTEEGHLTSEEICGRVRRKHPEIGAATVYRTLKLFCDAGVANAIRFGEGGILYEHRQCPHDHLICLSCGEIVEFECPMIEDQDLKIAAQHGYQLVNHRHLLFGYCPSCQERGVPVDPSSATES